MKKYTLDRIEETMYVFLEYPEEEAQLLVPINKYSGKLTEGDIVKISEIDSEYMVEVLEKETEIALEKVNALLEKLKNKNK